jgi:hypothetical protein
VPGASATSPRGTFKVEEQGLATLDIAITTKSTTKKTN